MLLPKYKTRILPVRLPKSLTFVTDFKKKKASQVCPLMWAKVRCYSSKYIYKNAAKHAKNKDCLRWLFWCCILGSGFALGDKSIILHVCFLDNYVLSILVSNVDWMCKV